VLIVGGDLEREGFVMLERGTAVQGMPATVNSTISTSPALPDG
jgi:hypothetical protein